MMPPSPPDSLVELLAASVAAHGPRPAFLTKTAGNWNPTSYSTFAGIVDEVRGGLAALGVALGDRVGVIAGNRIEWAAIAYATYGLGAALVPMYESQPAREWSFMAHDAGLKVLFVASAEIQARLAAVTAPLPALQQLVRIDGDDGNGLTIEALRRTGKARPAPALHPRRADIACLLYTSGTTADPKGVLLSHGNILSNVLAVLEVIPIGQQHLTLSFLPWAHAFGHTCELHTALAAGATLAIAESIDKVPDNLIEVRPTVLVAVPRVFQRVHAGFQKLMASKPAPLRWLVRGALAAARRRAGGQPLGAGDRLRLALAERLVFGRARARVGGRLQFAVSGAAALGREVGELIDGIGITVYEGYGLTETSPIATANVPGRRKLGSVGRALPGVRIAIDRGALPGGDSGAATDSTTPGDGEVIVYGPNVMRGYHDRPADNQTVFTLDGGLRTGDIGHLDADGFLYITGRLKEQYKLDNGKYVSPAPLEERLKLSPLIANVMIHGHNRPHNVALVVPAAEIAGQPEAHARIRAEIDRLSADWKPFERVRSVALVAEDFTVQSGLATPSLKIKRRQVVERYQAALDALYEGGDPSSP